MFVDRLTLDTEEKWACIMPAWSCLGWDERTQRDLPRLKAVLRTRHYARRSARICSFDIHSCPEQFGNIIPLFHSGNGGKRIEDLVQGHIASRWQK